MAGMTGAQTSTLFKQALGTGRNSIMASIREVEPNGLKVVGENLHLDFIFFE